MQATKTVILAIMLGASAAVQLPGQPPAAQLPDAPLKMHEWDMPYYPTQLLMEGVVRGEIRIAIEVDATGRLTDTLVLDYSNVALVRPALEAVRKWTFDPAVVNGEARSTTRGVLFDFRPDGPVVVESPNSSGSGPYLVRINNFGRGELEYQVSELRDLDRIPNPVRIVKPSVSLRADKASAPVRITVDFYIDEKGRVRMPSVGRDQDNPLGWASVRAVAQWEFAPPTVNGAPVTAHATQDFVFKP